MILTSGCIIGACCQINNCEVVPENTVVYGSSCIRRVQSEKPQVSSSPTPPCIRELASLVELHKIWCVLYFYFYFLESLSLRLCSSTSSWRFFPTTTTWRRLWKEVEHLWGTNTGLDPEESSSTDLKLMWFPPYALISHLMLWRVSLNGVGWPLAQQNDRRTLLHFCVWTKFMTIEERFCTCNYMFTNAIYS